MPNDDKLQVRAGNPVDTTNNNCPTAKKPRFDCPVSQTTAAEELWGDDFAVEDLDECFLLASQMCTDVQTQPVKTIVHNQQVQHLIQAKASGWQQVKAPFQNKMNTTHVVQQTQTTVPHTETTSSSRLHQNTNNTRPNLNDSKRPVPAQIITLQNQTANLHSISQEMQFSEMNAMKADLKKLIDENKKWKESLFSKDGEVSNLRRQLKQNEMKMNMQLEQKGRNCEEKLRAMKKELEIANTSMELKKLEAWKANDRLLLLSSSQNGIEGMEQHRDVSDEMLVFKANAAESNGSILNHLLNPHLYSKSDLEIHEVKLESKFSLQVSTTNRKRVSWRPSLYPYRLSVESSWTLANQLGLQDSFKTSQSKLYMEKVFFECRTILYGLLFTLRERAKEETLELLDRRDRQLTESQVDTLECPLLLSNKMWYEVERGVEARRALGLLSAICTLSEHMPSIVYNSLKKSITSENEPADFPCKATDGGGSIANFAFVETNHEIVASGCRMECTSAVEMDEGRSVRDKDNGHVTMKNNHQHMNKRYEKEMNKEKELRLKYEIKEIGFLNLLNDLANMIHNQRNSFEYSGFLTGMVTMMTASLCKGSIPASGNKVVGDIIRAVVFSRPRAETVVALSELLYALSSNIQVMETLCHGEENKPSGPSFNKPNSCVILALCSLLELRNTNVVSRTRLYRSVINWVWACIKQRPHRGPTWAQCTPGKTSGSCFCRARLAEVTIKLVYQTYRDFEVNALAELGESLRKALVRGIILLHQLTETDTEFGTYMQEAEGYYQWLLIGLRNTPHDLCMDQDEREALRDLLAMEDATEPHAFVETKKTENHLQDMCTSMKSCWATQSISHQVGTDIVETD